MREFRIMADWRLDPSDALDATGLELYKYFEFGLVAEKPPVKWIDDPACPGRMPAKITDKR